MPAPPGLLAAYPGLRETDEADPAVRTRLNVRDSDAVLVLHLDDLDHSPGTLLTVEVAESLGRPLLVARADHFEGAVEVERWTRMLPAGCRLDVAGPRESQDPGLYAAAYSLLRTLWTP